MSSASSSRPLPGQPAPLRIAGIPLTAARILFFLLGLVPLVRWIWLGATDNLGANPVEFLTRSSGTWTFICLLVTLANTPLRVLLRQPLLIRLRRMSGLFTFFYACLHFTTYIWWDQWFVLDSIVADVIERPFIALGFAAFLTMLPMAITSTKGWMRRLGPRWRSLHRLIYLTGLFAILHLWLHKAGKNDLQDVFIFGSVLAVLLGWRIWRRFRLL